MLGGITEGRARNPLDTGRACAQLIGLLRAHIEKENEVLYPMAERILAPEALESLGAAMAEG